MQNKSAPTLLKFNYAGKIVFVVPTPTYEEALDLAQQVFPSLRTVPRTSITFHLISKTTKTSPTHLVPVYISPAAWPGVMCTLHEKRSIIIEVDSHPKFDVEEALPPYEGRSVQRKKSWFGRLFA